MWSDSLVNNEMLFQNSLTALCVSNCKDLMLLLFIGVGPW